MQHVERCLFDLRRGLPVRLRNAEVDRLIWPLEYLEPTALGRLRRIATEAPALLITEHRLNRLMPEADKRPNGAARIAIAPDDTSDDIIRRACSPDATIDERPNRSAQTDDADQLALYLTRRALLIPAAVVVDVDPGTRAELDADVASHQLLSIEPDAVRRHHAERPAHLKRVSEAEVPLAEAPNTRFVVFREPDGVREHVALLIGDSHDWPGSVPVRIHSACLTGDLFGSLRCDCGEQLRGSVAAIAEHGGGVLLYLAQEGRGIGLANKMRAYHLQDDGLDTVDADQVLGFGDDERRYQVAGQMLAALDIHRIDLLTNNPAKIDAMAQDGITVAAREAIYGRLTPENRRYLNTKATRAGHWLDSLLDDAAEG